MSMNIRKIPLSYLFKTNLEGLQSYLVTSQPGSGFQAPHGFPVAWGAKPKQVVVTVINVLNSMISCI